MTDKSTATPYAFWTVPGSSFQVLYSLGVFREIDFSVNEGYRRIPHGGVEVGGVLFGRREPGGIRIEAFRSIECEHASGPSFVLSERDLAELRSQLQNFSSDPELRGLEAVGWFIAHTRSALNMNEREERIFADFFPGAGRLTLLVKPERFQPTRFAFFVRLDDRPLERDGSQRAIILPTVTQADNGTAPIPSPAAPPETAGSRGATASSPAPRPPVPPASSRPQPVQPLPPALPAAPNAPPPAPPPSVDAPAATAQLTPSSARTRVLQETIPAEPAIASPTVVSPFTGNPAPKEIPATVQPAPGAPAFPPRFEPTLPARSWQDFPSARPTRRMPDRGFSRARLAFVLVVAAALGCLVGYLAYLQLPPPIIRLSARVQAAHLVVSWPASQTRSAAYAAIRVDNGQPTPLSPAEKVAGETQIPAAGDDIKVELIVQHWIRDSRGIIRYLSATPASH